VNRSLVLLVSAVFAVLGCSRPVGDTGPGKGKDTGPADAHTVVKSVDACGNLSTEACSAKGGQLSADPRTQGEALPYLRAACARRDPNGCGNLGMVLSLSTDPTIRDGKAAVAAYEEGCSLGDLMACCDAGDTLERSTVIEKDLSRAAAFYKRGCDSADGMLICCIGLERLYKMGGPGVAKDRKRAAGYYRRAKLLGYSEHLEDD